MKNNPIRIPSYGSVTFSPISFKVLSIASEGRNRFRVHMNLRENHWYGWSTKSWVSPDYQIQVQNAYQKIYGELKPEIGDVLETAKNTNYVDTDAKALVVQAENEYNLSVSLADYELWEDAVSHLQTVSNLLVQAEVYEKDYWKPKANNQISTADQSIGQLSKSESSEAQSLIQQSQTKLINAKTSFNKATIEEYKNAYFFASQAISISTAQKKI